MHAVGPSRAGSVPGVRVVWAAALLMLESLHACMRSRVSLCLRGCGVRSFCTGCARLFTGPVSSQAMILGVLDAPDTCSER